MAAHLHDSVLQTLALIQRSADDPRRTVTLARRQERELREWLYGRRRRRADSTLGRRAAVAWLPRSRTCHDVKVELVVVGDRPLDDGVEALVAAVREATVNAAKHAGVDHVSVYVEVDGRRGASRSCGTGARASTRRRRRPTAADIAESIRRARIDRAPAGHRRRSTSGTGRRAPRSRLVAARPRTRRPHRDASRVRLPGRRPRAVPGRRAGRARRRRSTVVGEAADVDARSQVILAARPDVVLLDVHLPGGGGRAVMRARVRRASPSSRFLALSVSDAAEDVIAVIRAGARGYVTKTIAGRRARRRHPPGPRRRRGVLAPPRRLRARRLLRRRCPAPGRPRARPAHRPRAGGAAPHRPRLRLQGGGAARCTCR